MPLVRYFHQLLLGLWLGALACFAAVVAPTLFQVLTPAEAGLVVRRILPALDRWGLVSGVLLLLLGALYERGLRGRGLVRAALIAGMTLFAVTSAFWVTPKMNALRQLGRPLSELPEFGILHGVSSTLVAGEFIFGLVAAGLFLRREP